MQYIIGFILILAGGILTAVTEFFPFAIILFVGVFLFASVGSKAVFYDYVLSDTNIVLFRRRYYINFLPLTIVSLLLTLGKAPLLILRKEEYFKTALVENAQPVKLTRREYVALRNAQRDIYSTRLLPREFMERYYTENAIGFKRKKTRLIAVSVLAAVMLLLLVEPEALPLVLLYEAVFVPMIFLWIPEYKDAKILQQAYDRSLGNHKP